MEVKEDKYWVVTQEGKTYLEKGTPEFQIYQAIEQGKKREDLAKLFDDATFKVGFSNAMGKKWIEVKDGLG